MSVICADVLMGQGGICRGTVGQNMPRLAGREKMSIKIMG